MKVTPPPAAAFTSDFYSVQYLPQGILRTATSTDPVTTQQPPAVWVDFAKLSVVNGALVRTPNFLPANSLVTLSLVADTTDASAPIGVRNPNGLLMLTAVNKDGNEVTLTPTRKVAVTVSFQTAPLRMTAVASNAGRTLITLTFNSQLKAAPDPANIRIFPTAGGADVVLGAITLNNPTVTGPGTLTIVVPTLTAATSYTLTLSNTSGQLVSDRYDVLTDPTSRSFTFTTTP